MILFHHLTLKSLLLVNQVHLQDCETHEHYSEVDAEKLFDLEYFSLTIKEDVETEKVNLSVLEGLPQCA